MYSVREVVSDKFWIVDDKHGKVGTLNACDGGYRFYNQITGDISIVTSMQEFVTAEREDLNSKDIFMVNGYPTRFKTGIVVENDELPLFKKTATSNVVQVAGFFCVKTEKVGWGDWSCPTLSTLGKNEWRGPFRTEWEMYMELKRLKSQDA